LGLNDIHTLDDLARVAKRKNGLAVLKRNDRHCYIKIGQDLNCNVTLV
jgi:hypothetical protein